MCDPGRPPSNARPILIHQRCQSLTSLRKIRTAGIGKPNQQQWYSEIELMRRLQPKHPVSPININSRSPFSLALLEIYPLTCQPRAITPSLILWTPSLIFDRIFDLHETQRPLLSCTRLVRADSLRVQPDAGGSRPREESNRGKGSSPVWQVQGHRRNRFHLP